MGKRKRDLVERGEPVVSSGKEANEKKILNGHEPALAAPAAPVTIQIVVGTYEKVLHGVQATISKPAKGGSPTVEFSDTFLLSPHGSAIRCLAISPLSSSDPSRSQKVILASGSSDQIVNLYHISREAPWRQKGKGVPAPTLAGNKITENPKNRELGSLQHHNGGLNALYFPTRSKLLSAAEDNTIAVARTRDWTVLSTIKAPIPKAHGRPSGDTAPLGGTPAGVNDFAVHPSMKLMVSVGKGEKCMRLWNLVTGKKAGVLNFERDLLQGVGEGRWASGEGRRVEWNSLGEEFVVGFERGCVLFGMDCKPKSRILPLPFTKIHQLHYMTLSGDSDVSKEVLAVSTEDGRLLFYSTASAAKSALKVSAIKSGIPECKALGQLGGATEGLTGRIKDFDILKSPDSQSLLIVAGSSDGAVRLWTVEEADLEENLSDHEDSSETEVDGPANSKTMSAKEVATDVPTVKQIGRLLGTYEAGNRITCLKAFVMSEPERFKAKGLQDGTNANIANSPEMEDESNVSS